MTDLWAGYLRRSVKGSADADISETTQRAAILRRIPEGDDIEWFEDLDLSGGSYDHRPAYLAMIGKMRAGAFVGIVAYDLSRLHRDTSNALALRDECANLGVILRTDDSNLTAHEELNEPSHKLMFTVRAGVGDYERERIRKRGREGARVEFEAGGPRGADWFGYKTSRVWNEAKQAFLPKREGGVVRVLEVVEPEAAVVRRIFRDLAHMTMREIAEQLNVEGAISPTTKGWSAGAVRSIWDNRFEYAGYVTLGHHGRGNAKRFRLDMDRRPGRHQPLITEAELRDAIAGVEGRRTGVSKPKRAHRMYLLAGVAVCGVCGSRLRGEPRTSTNGKVYRYLGCPVSDKRGVWVGPDGTVRTCDARRARAEEAEAAVLERLATGVLPEEAIEAAREELRDRLKAPKPGLIDQQRARLEARLVALGKQHGWNHISDAEYLAERETTERQLAALPGADDRLALFERSRTIAVTMAENLERATPEQVREFVTLLVERVVIREREVSEIVLVPTARPFFDRVLARPARLELTTFRSAT